MRNILHCFYLLFFLNTSYSFAQKIEKIQQVTEIPTSTPLPFINQFVKNLANDSIAIDIILSQNVYMSDNIEDDMIDYLIASLQEMRLNLQLKNISKLDIVPFKSLSRKETKDIEIETHKADNIYFVRYNNKLVFPLLISQNKIHSFTLVSKGNKKAHFVTY